MGSRQRPQRACFFEGCPKRSRRRGDCSGARFCHICVRFSAELSHRLSFGSWRHFCSSTACPAALCACMHPRRHNGARFSSLAHEPTQGSPAGQVGRSREPSHKRSASEAGNSPREWGLFVEYSSAVKDVMAMLAVQGLLSAALVLLWTVISLGR